MTASIVTGKRESFRRKKRIVVIGLFLNCMLWNFLNLCLIKLITSILNTIIYY